MRRTAFVLFAVLASLSGCKPSESSYAIFAYAKPSEISEGGESRVTAAVLKSEKAEKGIDVDFSAGGCGKLSKRAEKTNEEGNAIVSFAGGTAADRDCVATITAHTHGLRSDATVTVHPKPVEADATPSAGATLPTPAPHARIDVKVGEIVKGKQWRWIYLVTMKDGGFDKILLTFDVAAGSVASTEGGTVTCMLPGGDCKLWKVAFSTYTSSAALTVDSDAKPGGNVKFEIVRGTNIAGRTEDYSATLQITGPQGS